jgi:hypothetical protein
VFGLFRPIQACLPPILPPANCAKPFSFCLQETMRTMTATVVLQAIAPYVCGVPRGDLWSGHTQHVSGKIATVIVGLCCCTVPSADSGVIDAEGMGHV